MLIALTNVIIQSLLSCGTTLFDKVFNYIFLYFWYNSINLFKIRKSAHLNEFSSLFVTYIDFFEKRKSNVVSSDQLRDFSSRLGINNYSVLYISMFWVKNIIYFMIF